jgi:hypothetical protein
MTYVTPGHPVKDGAGYDCQCGQCLAARAEQARAAAYVGPLACPKCDNADSLATIEAITGTANADRIAREQGGSVDIRWQGRTEVDWDSSTTVGVMCMGCTWSYRGDDWDEQLAPVKPEPDDEDEPDVTGERISALYRRYEELRDRIADGYRIGEVRDLRPLVAETLDVLAKVRGDDDPDAP